MAEDTNKYNKPHYDFHRAIKQENGTRWNPITQAPMSDACGRGYNPLCVTKEDPAVVCQTMPLYQMNSKYFMHT
jgi:hypothetical protein